MRSVSSPAEAGWTQSWRGRVELLAAAGFLATCVGVPSFFWELYPFSRVPMFSDSPQQIFEYDVYDSAGNRLRPRDFGLQLNYRANPEGVGYGFEPPFTANRATRPADEVQLKKTVAGHLRERRDLPFVDIVEKVCKAVDSQHVAFVETRRWRIANPELPAGGGS